MSVVDFKRTAIKSLLFVIVHVYCEHKGYVFKVKKMRERG